MKNSELLRALQTEIQNHDLSTFMSDKHKIVQTGWSAQTLLHADSMLKFCPARGPRTLSREDKQIQNKALEEFKVEVQEITKEPKFKWQDSLTVVAVILAILAVFIDDIVAVRVCFVVSAVLICYSISTHTELSGRKRFALCLLVLGFFSVLIYRATGAYEKKELAKWSGGPALVPDSGRTPKIACGPAPEGALTVLFGSVAAYTSRPSLKVVQSGGIPRIQIKKDKNGGILVTTDIYDENENVVVEIKDNTPSVSNEAFSVEREKSKLVVTLKHRKEKVLDIYFVNPRTIRINGVFRFPHTETIVANDEITKIGERDFSNNCFAEVGEGIFRLP